MSLVHEALRKAEREKQRKLGTAPAAPTPHVTSQPVRAPIVHSPAVATPVAPVVRAPSAHTPAPTVERPTDKNNFFLPMLIGCVAIVAIIAIVFIVRNATSVLRQSKEAPPVVASAVPAPVAKSTPPAESQPAVAPAVSTTTPSVPSPAAPAAPVVDESKYQISGIMKDPDGKPVAVLNGRVAYEGFYVDGATVKKIDTDRVTLDVKGHEVVLRLF